jgi:hypothetical protein
MGKEGMKARENHPLSRRSEEIFSEPKKALIGIGDESKEKLPFRTDVLRRFF